MNEADQIDPLRDSAAPRELAFPHGKTRLVSRGDAENAEETRR